MPIFAFPYKNHLDKGYFQHLHSELSILKCFDKSVVRVVFPDPIFPAIAMCILYFFTKIKKKFYRII